MQQQQRWKARVGMVGVGLVAAGHGHSQVLEAGACRNLRGNGARDVKVEREVAGRGERAGIATTIEERLKQAGKEEVGKR